jgi:flagellar FliL protein
MVEEDLREDIDDAGGGKKGGLPTIVIIIIVAALMGVGGFFVGRILSGGEKEKPPVTQPENQQAKKQEETTNSKDQAVAAVVDGQEQKQGQEFASKSKSGILPLDAFTVNLNDPFARRYVEVLVNLEIKNKAYIPKITENELMIPRMRDEIFMIISAKSYSELNSTSGKVALKEEIQMRINELMKEEFGQEPVSQVYFTKFIIQ